MVHLQVFHEASQTMSGEDYPTLSLSLVTYVSLLRHISNIAKSPVVRANSTLKTGVQACKAKLEKWFDQSTYDSVAYYIATSAYFCSLWRPLD